MCVYSYFSLLHLAFFIFFFFLTTCCREASRQSALCLLKQAANCFTEFFALLQLTHLIHSFSYLSLFSFLSPSSYAGVCSPFKHHHHRHRHFSSHTRSPRSFQSLTLLSSHVKTSSSSSWPLNRHPHRISHFMDCQRNKTTNGIGN